MIYFFSFCGPHPCVLSKYFLWITSVSHPGVSSEHFLSTKEQMHINAHILQQGLHSVGGVNQRDQYLRNGQEPQ